MIVQIGGFAFENRLEVDGRLWGRDGQLLPNDVSLVIEKLDREPVEASPEIPSSIPDSDRTEVVLLP